MTVQVVPPQKNGNFSSRVWVRKFTHVAPVFLEFLLLCLGYRALDVAHLLKYVYLLLLTSDLARVTFMPSLDKHFFGLMQQKDREKTSVTSSTLYFSGVYVNLLLGHLFDKYLLCYFAGLISLAIGDPAAYIFGKLFNPNSTVKTFHGSLGCFLSCVIAQVLLLQFLVIPFRMDLLEGERGMFDEFHRAEELMYYAVIVIGALAATAAEWVGGEFDNVFIASGTGIAMHAAAAAIKIFVKK